MYERLNQFMSEMHILYPFHRGCHPGHSTYVSLITMQDLISTAVNTTKIIHWHISGPNKCIWYCGPHYLTQKLKNSGTSGTPHLWFKSYLEYRHQQVLDNRALSRLKIIRLDVPQGSNLGPLLFLLFRSFLTFRTLWLNWYFSFQ